jgi:hypothetical protein
MFVGMPQGRRRAFPEKEVGIQVLAGLAASSSTVGSLLRTPLARKDSQKNESSKLIFKNLQT